MLAEYSRHMVGAGGDRTGKWRRAARSKIISTTDRREGTAFAAESRKGRWQSNHTVGAQVLIALARFHRRPSARSPLHAKADNEARLYLGGGYCGVDGDSDDAGQHRAIPSGRDGRHRRVVCNDAAR